MRVKWVNDGDSNGGEHGRHTRGLLQSFYNFRFEARARCAQHRGMNKGQGWLILCLWLCAATVTQASLLEEVIREPGMWNQMCGMPGPLAFDVPLPMYGLATPRNFYLSEANLDRLRGQRAAAGADIVKLLNRMDLSKATNGPRPFSTTGSGQDPQQLSGTLLDIILRLNAVEALPGLLRVEADLNQRLATATSDPSSLPDLDLDSPVMEVVSYKDDLKDALSPRRRREFAARIYQREMLSVIASLLRHEHYQPLLDSDLEASYFAHLKQGSGDPQLAGIHAEGDVPSDQRGWIGYDLIHKLPYLKDPFHSGFVPYTPELRLEIRKWAADYLRQTPAKKAPDASPKVK